MGRHKKNPDLLPSETIDLAEADVRSSDGMIATLEAIVRDPGTSDFSRMNAVAKLIEMQGLAAPVGEMPQTTEGRLEYIRKVMVPTFLSFGVELDFGDESPLVQAIRA